jgi:hypothetical protein
MHMCTSVCQCIVLCVLSCDICSLLRSVDKNRSIVLTLLNSCLWDFVTDCVVLWQGVAVLMMPPLLAG